MTVSQDYSVLQLAQEMELFLRHFRFVISSGFTETAIIEVPHHLMKFRVGLYKETGCARALVMTP